MSSLLRPVGHLPAGVYWFRRGLVLAVLVALVIVLLRVFGGGEDPDNAATTTPSITVSTVSPSSSTTPGVSACAGRDVTIAVVPSNRTVASGGSLTFAVVLGAVGTSCVAQVDPAKLTLTIMSGRDRIWTSAHCSRVVPKATAILAEGKGFTSTVPWDGRRSAAGCLPGQAVARAGTYTAQAAYDGRLSAAQAFRVV